MMNINTTAHASTGGTFTAEHKSWTQPCWNIRKYTLDDSDNLRVYFNGLSRSSHRQRFQCSMDTVHNSVLALYDSNTHPSNVALIATIEGEPNRICGEALLACNTSGQDAEIALSVGEQNQRQGMGKALVKELVRMADDLGMPRVYADTLRTNQRFIALAESIGFERRKHPDDWRQIRLSLGSDSKLQIRH